MVTSRRDFFTGSCRWWCCGAAPVIGQPLTVDGARALAADINRQREAIKQRQGAGVRQQGTFPTHARDFIDRHARPKTRRWRERARLLGYDFPPDGDDAAPVLIKGSLSDRWRDRSEEKARAAAGGFPSTALVRLCAYLSFRLELCDEAIAAKQKVAEQAKQAVGVNWAVQKAPKSREPMLAALVARKPMPPMPTLSPNFCALFSMN